MTTNLRAKENEADDNSLYTAFFIYFNYICRREHCYPSKAPVFLPENRYKWCIFNQANLLINYFFVVECKFIY
ncbi:hypothetical protein BDGGKGIB_02912 [Nodularia sphaerocarpa UHCC 0038]|nr:hypothetical protein BDGGKGIB_02912 [Nodularia sphaerocarpa UHCC 0038]